MIELILYVLLCLAWFLLFPIIGFIIGHAVLKIKYLVENKYWLGGYCEYIMVAHAFVLIAVMLVSIFMGVSSVELTIIAFLLYSHVIFVTNQVLSGRLLTLKMESYVSYIMLASNFVYLIFVTYKVFG